MTEIQEETGLCEKKRKNDRRLIIGILLVATMLLLGTRLYANLSTGKAQAVVTVDGQIYKSYSLDVDIDEEIRLPDGGSNHFVIKNGSVNMVDADCPDKICVHHVAISKNKETIVCLPHKLVICIENGDPSDLDAIAQ